MQTHHENWLTFKVMYVEYHRIIEWLMSEGTYSNNIIIPICFLTILKKTREMKIFPRILAWLNLYPNRKSLSRKLYVLMGRAVFPRTHF